MNSNEVLENKINKANEEYKLILQQLKEKPLYEDEQHLIKKVQDSDKEIAQLKEEIDFYKKKIDSVKNKLEFKMNLENAISLETLVKAEANKNKELKTEYENLLKINNKQTKKLNYLDSENKYKEKIEVLKNEIKNLKEAIKDTNDKFIKQERFLKLMHEKIAYIETQAKKLNSTKVETVKHFSKEDLKDVLNKINKIKVDINENRDKLKSNAKQNEDKILNMKKEIKELDKHYEDNEKINKTLIFKRNELKRLVKLLSENRLSKLNKIDIKNILKYIGETKNKEKEELKLNMENSDMMDNLDNEVDVDHMKTNQSNIDSENNKDEMNDN